MATTMMLSDLRNAVRQRSNMENSTFITDVELNSYINQSYFELYDLLVQKYGSHYFVSAPYTLTTDGVSEFYPLPADFYKLAGISVKQAGSNGYFTIKQGSFSDMQRVSGNASGYGFGSGYGLCVPMYALTADNLWLAPIAQSGQKIRLFYVPRLVQLALDTDTVEGVSGWTEYIICDASIKCLQKEESDVSVLGLEKSALIKRIEEAANNRDAASSATVSDTSSHDGWR